jgi:hypothetical protein
MESMTTWERIRANLWLALAVGSVLFLLMILWMILSS